MHIRAIQFLTLFLAATTGVGLLGAAALVTDAPVGSGAEVANIALARSYYGAVDDVLRTGDPATLDALIAPHFQDYGAAGGVGSGREGLKQYLAALGATYPGATLTVVDLLADGDRVMARLRTKGTSRMDFVGVPLQLRPIALESLEILRFSDGKVVERWGSHDAVSHFQPLGQTTFDQVPSAPVVVALARITYAPGADLRSPRLPALPGPGTVVVEAGTLTVAGDGLARVARGTAAPPDRTEVTSPGIDSTLHAGDVAIFPTGASSVRNDGSTAAVVLALAFIRPDDVGRAIRQGPSHHNGRTPFESLVAAMFFSTDEPFDLPPGLTVERLAGGVMGELPPDPVDVAFGRASLVPGERLPSHDVAGAELLAVEAGTLSVTSGGLGQRLDGASSPNSEIDTEFGPGSGLFVSQGERSSIRNAGTVFVTFVLVTLTPASP